MYTYSICAYKQMCITTHILYTIHTDICNGFLCSCSLRFLDKVHLMIGLLQPLWSWYHSVEFVKRLMLVLQHIVTLVNNPLCSVSSVMVQMWKKKRPLTIGKCDLGVWHQLQQGQASTSCGSAGYDWCWMWSWRLFFI